MDDETNAHLTPEARAALAAGGVPPPKIESPNPFEPVRQMHMRDWFAAMALAGMNAHSGYTGTMDDDEVRRARSAYRQADAMIGVRDS